MSIDAHISCCSWKTLSFAVGNMLLCLGISILLSHTKIDQVYCVGIRGSLSTNKKVVWFNITVYQIVIMDTLDTSNLEIYEYKQVQFVATANRSLPYVGPMWQQSSHWTFLSMYQINPRDWVPEDQWRGYYVIPLDRNNRQMGYQLLRRCVR